MNNEHDPMCERCGEEPAGWLIEHATYGEAVCISCVNDQHEWEMRKAEQEREQAFMSIVTEPMMAYED